MIVIEQFKAEYERLCNSYIMQMSTQAVIENYKNDLSILFNEHDLGDLKYTIDVHDDRLNICPLNNVTYLALITLIGDEHI